MTIEMKDKIRDMLYAAYECGVVVGKNVSTVLIDNDVVLDAFLDSIVLAEMCETPSETPKKANVDFISWVDSYYGCVDCLCKKCALHSCGEDCPYSELDGEDCETKHDSDVIGTCPHFEPRD